ncbi:hypothetical protein BBO_03536 [Beauveria brongniartii RCEF 3172]|uniref:Uncharacterized protein n=1 Tax=Beauveria brongniartii RCEF 3172 TaxID=1081107 RepID=A0A167FXW2_9HYPO|nr:hypothetical protein BBO_03536 [Beauveria brongniartii RCEF 3172]
MEFGFIGHELYATTAQDASSPSSSSPSPTTSHQQQTPLPASATVDSQAGMTYIPVERIVTEVDAVRNTILVGLLIALVAASVALGGLAIYCFRRRARRRLQSGYQAELRAAQQNKSDEERAAE